jgi:hypothetical protein
MNLAPIQIEAGWEELLLERRPLCRITDERTHCLFFLSTFLTDAMRSA